MTETDILNEYKLAFKRVSENMLEEQDNTVEISSGFARDIKELICNGMLASDYRQYFFNFPTDSYLHSDKQQRLINIILYDRDVTKEDKFDELVTDVIATDKTIITTTFKRQDKLGVLYSYCIFYSKELFDLALENNVDKVWETIENKLDYEQQAIATTSRLLLPVIKHHMINDQEYMTKICDILSRKAQAQALVVLRKNIIESFKQNITSFEALFFGICPLITKTEVDMLKHNEKLLHLINLESKELNMELLKTIHVSVLSGFDLSEEKVFNEVASFYEKMYAVFGTIENETMTLYMFDIMRAAKQMHEVLENLILKNNSSKDIKEAYTELICMIAEDKSLSEQTLEYILELQIHSGLNSSVCEQLKHRGYYESYIINACSTDISMIDFKLPEIIKGVTSIDYKRKTDGDFLKQLLFVIREQILMDLSEAEIEHYKNLFMYPYEIIREHELHLVTSIKRVLELIDVQQINSDNSLYITKYFNRCRRSQNESYEILHFICGIKNGKLKKTIFLALDFDFIQYYRISKERREEIVESMSSVFDFNKLDDQIQYMSKTKFSYVPFEKVINIAIKENKFDNYVEKYVDFVRDVKHVNNETIENLCSIDSYYPMPQRVLDKLYSMKKFEYYVSAKTMEEEIFAFEVDKLNVLDETYKNIFNAGENDFQYSKKYMADNMSFVAYMCEQKCYENQQTYNRILYVKCAQSIECLEELIRNNSVVFAIEYLSKIDSFKNDAAEKYFVDIAKSYVDIAASDAVYKNTYKKLTNSELKRKYTRYHNRAKNII